MGTESITTSGDHADRAVLQAKNGLTSFLTNPIERTRFLRFALVGLMGFFVDVGVFNLGISLAHIISIYASMISFTVAVTCNFLWNRYWIYPDSRSKPLIGQITQFILVSIIGMGIRAALFALIENPLIQLFTSYGPRKFFLTSTFLGHNTTLAVSVVIVMMWNFFANRYWTYNDVSASNA